MYIAGVKSIKLCIQRESVRKKLTANTLENICLVSVNPYPPVRKLVFAVQAIEP